MQILFQMITIWRYKMEGYAEEGVVRYCELAGKAYQLQSKRKRHAWMITNVHPKVPTVQANWHPMCAKIVPICLSLARIGRLDLHWTVNMLARSVTMWNKSSGKEKMARLKSYINQTKHYSQECLVGGKIHDCKLGLPCGKMNSTIRPKTQFERFFFFD